MIQQTKVDHIPLGRRIAEIMEDKGEAFSIRALGQRIGISKDILCRCINGERYIKPSELERIAAGLKISIERIKQEDVCQEVEELQKLLKSQANLKRAFQLAESLVVQALGITEKSKALNNLGRALFITQKYERAHTVWSDAYQLAKEHVDKYGNSDILYDVFTNLLISFTVRKEYTRLQEMIDEVEPTLTIVPERAGAVYYSIAMIAYQKQDMDEANKKLYQSLQCFEQTNDIKSVGMAERNVAYIEYKQQNYETAKQFFEAAIPKLYEDEHWQLEAIKDYIKTLIRLNDLDRATELIQESLQKAVILKKAELEGKLYLLLSRANNNAVMAQTVLQNDTYGIKVQRLACKYLLNHFAQMSDAESLLRYYKIAEGLMITHDDILEEDDL